MPAPHHSLFYRLHALPAAQPTVFKAHMNGKVSVVLNRNCFLKMKDFKNMPPTSNHVLRKVIVSKKWCKINTLLLHTANRKYCMADQFVLFPLTLKVICLLQNLSNAIWRIFVRHFARFELTRRSDARGIRYSVEPSFSCVLLGHTSYSLCMCWVDWVIASV